MDRLAKPWGETMAHGQSFTFDNPHELQSTLHPSHKVIPVHGGIFRADWTGIDFERLSMQSCETSADMIVHSATDATHARIWFLADSDQGPWLQNGRELPDDGIAVYRPGAVNHHL